MEVIQGGNKTTGTFKPKCTVQLDNTVETFTEFVMIAYNDDTGMTSIRRSADALTMGRAMILIKDAFNEMFDDLAPKEQAELKSLLYGGLENG